MAETGAAWPLFGHGAAQAAFLDAFERQRFHHAWLIEGPSGIGKATLARRMAAFLLGARGPDGLLLDAPVNDPVVQKLNAEAHPDLRWLSRRPDDKGKIPQDIKVEDIRTLASFFALRSGLGGWRVGVIDSLDELNRSGANALLKTLEEPPGRCALILVNHGTRPVLATIRSRCRLLRLARLGESDVLRAIRHIAPDGVEPEAAATLADGRPAHGIRLASPTGMAAANAARSFVRALPSPSDAAIVDFIQRISVDETAFSAGVAEILAGLDARTTASPAACEAWLAVSRICAQATELNMDRVQAAAKIAACVQDAMNGG